MKNFGLMQQYQKLIYTVCLQFVHEPHTAEDLTQDTFLSAFSAIDLCEPQYYKQWLVRVAANKCKDHLKSAWVRKVDAPGTTPCRSRAVRPAATPTTRPRVWQTAPGPPSWKHWCAVCASPTAELPCCTFWSTGNGGDR
ncbi:sigma-70 family RNA polymerase sigma factor [Gemmiger formicilis]|nr:sigma-70 family RNA polymerase sigma factor [Gemmiger formicilis]